MKTVIGLNGACGRMSRRIAQLAREDPVLMIGAALEAPGQPDLGKDYGEILGIGPIGLPLSASLKLDARVNVVIDFSLPQGTMTILPVCVERSIPLVVATTGLTRAQKEEVEAAAHHTAILMAPNMSLGVNVLLKLVAEAGRVLNGKNFDVEITERHHRHKKDSPSGTALHFARVIQEQMGQTQIRNGREGEVGERSPDEIGIHAIRVGDNVGEHTVIFSTEGETLEFSHRAHSRDCYARGALAAAKFLADRPPGRYTMEDVLGL